MADWLEAGALALSAFGAYKGAQAAGQAASTQAAAAERAAQISSDQFQITRSDLAPWRAVGEDALYRQGAALGIIPTAPGVDRFAGFRDSPGYQFALGEGQKTIERSAASRGMLKSGQTMKALQTYGQNMADQNYQSYLNNLGILSGTGQQTSVQTGQLGASAAATQGSALRSAGDARASGYLGRAGAWQQGLSDLSGYLGYTS